MARGFPGFRQGGRPGRALPVTCDQCGTDRHLTVRSVTHLPVEPSDVVMVAYTCGRCRLFKEHAAYVADLSAILGRPEQTGDVLIFGGHYMHCGQPMEKIGSDLRRLSAPLTTEDSTTGGTGQESLDVYLRTRVLRCACGFQMELPD